MCLYFALTWTNRVVVLYLANQTETLEFLNIRVPLILIRDKQQQQKCQINSVMQKHLQRPKRV